MTYQGSKRKIVKHLLPFIYEKINEKLEKYGRCKYIEPFVGGANVVGYMDDWRSRGVTYYGYDVNPITIDILNKIKSNEIRTIADPNWIYNHQEEAKQKYKQYRALFNDNKKDFDAMDEVCKMYPDFSYYGFCLGFSGLLFGSCIIGLKTWEEKLRQTTNALTDTQDGIQKVAFERLDFGDLEDVDETTVIYCDPPYLIGTIEKYVLQGSNRSDFRKKMDRKLKEWTDKGATVLISETIPHSSRWKELTNISTTRGITCSGTQEEQLFEFI